MNGTAGVGVGDCRLEDVAACLLGLGMVFPVKLAEMFIALAAEAHSWLLFDTLVAVDGVGAWLADHRQLIRREKLTALATDGLFSLLLCVCNNVTNTGGAGRVQAGQHMRSHTVAWHLAAHTALTQLRRHRN